eukprot:g149.t1
MSLALRLSAVLVCALFVVKGDTAAPGIAEDEASLEGENGEVEVSLDSDGDVHLHEHAGAQGEKLGWIRSAEELGALRSAEECLVVGLLPQSDGSDASNDVYKREIKAFTKLGAAKGYLAEHGVRVALSNEPGVFQKEKESMENTGPPMLYVYNCKMGAQGGIEDTDEDGVESISSAMLLTGAPTVKKAMRAILDTFFAQAMPDIIPFSLEWKPSRLATESEYPKVYLPFSGKISSHTVRELRSMATKYKGRVLFISVDAKTDEGKAFLKKVSLPEQRSGFSILFSDPRAGELGRYSVSNGIPGMQTWLDGKLAKSPAVMHWAATGKRGRKSKKKQKKKKKKNKKKKRKKAEKSM